MKSISENPAHNYSARKNILSLLGIGLTLFISEGCADHLTKMRNDQRFDSTTLPSNPKPKSKIKHTSGQRHKRGEEKPVPVMSQTTWENNSNQGINPDDGIDLSKFAKGSRSAINTCHTLASKRDPNIKGKLNANLEINSNGAITKITFSGIANPTLVRCIRAEIKRWSFSAGTDRNLDFPIIFTPSE